MNGIIILSVGEGIVGFLMFIIGALVFFGGFQFIAQKYFGTRFHGKFGAPSAFEENRREKESFEYLSKVDPVGINVAISSCKRKKYSLTHQNILSEYYKNI
ncbi:hypothetical protein ACUNWD_07105 [Sunxiuqinia sp. A32]|uniref:hypothetical protein n=1 Tax=Sunxiuqinia sp. A32 TaxID=3461496 RepID=UPI0040456366